jgi:beta-phosphoglucomutase-like phosphatase (HAD superfamily)
VDSEPVWFQARADLFREYGKEWTWSDQARTMGVSTAEWVRIMSEGLKERLSDEMLLNSMIERMKAYYRAGEIEKMPGADAAIRLCAERFSLGLASGSYPDLINAALDGAGWQEFFSEVLSSDEVNAGKPAPDVYLEIARRMSIRPGEMIVLEDSENGILAGCHAGAKVIVVPSQHKPPSKTVLDQAALVIDSLHSLASALETLTVFN